MMNRIPNLSLVAGVRILEPIQPFPQELRRARTVQREDTGGQTSGRGLPVQLFAGAADGVEHSVG